MGRSKEEHPFLAGLQRFMETYPLISVLPVFTVLSHIIFRKFYETSVEVIDEEFHLQQARDYCALNLNIWHPKITTLPGLYYLGIPCNLFGRCDTYCFRHVSFVASVVNLALFFKILQLRHKSCVITNLISAINLSCLSPLYFFSHLYYSDVASMTTILLMVYFSLRNQHIFASIFGACSILMRQTNVIWVIMFAGQYFLSYFMPPSIHGVSTATLLRDMVGKVAKVSFTMWCNFLAYGIVILGFVGFVWYNGGIVVGDKSAHQAELHLPQLFYFSLFTIVFGLPHLFKQIRYYFKSFALFNKWYSLLSILAIVLIIHFNTLEHPYLLADNRHYTFYMWNRCLKYYSARIAMTLVYHFGIFALTSTFYEAWHFFTFVPCLIMVLCFQKLVEVRYFIVPFVLWRLQLRNVKIPALVFEFLLYLLVNFLTIKIFFEKEIKWDDRIAVQRMIW